MAKEEVVENKYAGCNIFLSFSSSHMFFPAFSLAVLAPPPSDVHISHSRTHRATSLILPPVLYCYSPSAAVLFNPEGGGSMFLHNIRKSVPEYSVTSQNTASFIMIFYVTFKFNVAGTKSDIVTEVNIC